MIVTFIRVQVEYKRSIALCFNCNMVEGITPQKLRYAEVIGGCCYSMFILLKCHSLKLSSQYQTILSLSITLKQMGH